MKYLCLEHQLLFCLLSCTQVMSRMKYCITGCCLIISQDVVVVVKDLKYYFPFLFTTGAIDISKLQFPTILDKLGMKDIQKYRIHMKEVEVEDEEQLR